MNKVLSIFICALLVLSACKEKKEVAYCNEAQTWEEDPIGNWYVGDFHVHATGASNDTGGDSYPIDIKQKAIERGLDFVVLTDHSNSTGSDASTTAEDSTLFNQGPEFPYWDTAALLSDANFLMINGNEISPVNADNSIPTGHVGCIPKSLNTFNKNYVFTDRPKGTVTGASALRQAKDAGCFNVLNHPYSPTPWIAFDWTSYNYEAIEVWNGTLGFDVYDQYGYDVWICDLLSGKKVSPIGASDCHRVNTAEPGVVLDPALGYPSTAVFAQSFTWDNIMEGLEEGNVSIFEGESRLFINEYTEGKCHAYGEDVYWIRLRGKADINLIEPRIILNYYTSCNDPRPSTDEFAIPNTNIFFEQEIVPGESFDVAIKIEGKKGVFTAILKGNSTHYLALSKAIIVN